MQRADAALTGGEQPAIRPSSLELGLDVAQDGTRADLRLSDQELLILREAVGVLDPRHPTALDPATALVVIEELLELRRALERVGVQVGELQQLLEGAHRRQP